MKLNVENTAKLREMLQAVNGRAKTHTMNEWGVQYVAEKAEKTLDSHGLPKKHRAGAVVIYTPAGPGDSYARLGRYVMSNRIHLVRGSKNWFLVKADKMEIYSTSKENFALKVTCEQMDIMEKALFEDQGIVLKEA